MLNYIKSEWYRLIRDKSYWVLTFIFSVLVLAASIVLNISDKTTPNFPYANTYMLFSTIVMMMYLPFFLVSIIPSVIVGEEIKENTLKNSVSFGISRSTIFFGKWIISIIALFILAVITVSISIISGYLLLEDSGISFLSDYLYGLLGVMPLMLAGLTTYHTLYFITKNRNYVILIFSAIYILPFLVGNYMWRMFQPIDWVYRHCVLYLLTNNDMRGKHFIVAGNTVNGLKLCYSVGLSLTVLFLVIGYLHFLKKEIK